MKDKQVTLIECGTLLILVSCIPGVSFSDQLWIGFIGLIMVIWGTLD